MDGVIGLENFRTISSKMIEIEIHYDFTDLVLHHFRTNHKSQGWYFYKKFNLSETIKVILKKGF